MAKKVNHIHFLKANFIIIVLLMNLRMQDSPQLPPIGNALLVSSKENGASPDDGIAAVPDNVSSLLAPEVQTMEPNRNLLLNKIDRLQRTNVRLMEKIDFMQEHIGQLTQELQKKTKILQVCEVFTE